MNVTVGQNAVLALSRLWAKVHQILRECKGHFVVKKYFFPLAVACSLSKIFVLIRRHKIILRDLCRPAIKKLTIENKQHGKQTF